MRRYAVVLIVAGACLAAGLVKPTWAAAGADGAIVAVGGGDTNDAIVARTLELAGGRNAVVAVLPQSSALLDAGDSSVESSPTRETARWRCGRRPAREPQ